jgi:fucose permease
LRLPKKLTASGNVLVLLSLMYFITYVDRVNISTAAPAIKGEFGLSNTELGLVFSAFAYPYALFQVFGGWLGDKLGARRTLFLCGLIWSAATMLTGLAVGLASLFVIRVMLGFGEGATFPTATRAMQNWVARDRRGFAQGFVHSAARLGNAITPPLVAALILLLTWRGSFVLLGFVSLLWVLVWVWYYRDDPRQHRGVTAAELARLPVFKPKMVSLFGRDRFSVPACTHGERRAERQSRMAVGNRHRRRGLDGRRSSSISRPIRARSECCPRWSPTALCSKSMPGTTTRSAMRAAWSTWPTLSSEEALPARQCGRRSVVGAPAEVWTSLSRHDGGDQPEALHPGYPAKNMRARGSSSLS